MTSIKRQWMCASLAGLLSFLSYDCGAGAFIIPIAVALLCYGMSHIRNEWHRCLFLALFYSVWAVLQMFFLVKKIETDSWTVLLVLIAEIAVLISPTIPITIFLKKRPAESAVCALLISDFIFSSIPVGNYFFLIGLPVSFFSEAIQWIKFTGPSSLSLWTVLIGYLLYRAICYKSRIEWLMLSTVILLPIAFSLTMNLIAHNSSYDTIQKNVALIGIADNDGMPYVTSLIKYTSMRGNDFFILPEGFIVTNETEKDYLPISTMLKRLSKRDSISILYGIMTYADGQYTNAVKMVSPDNQEQIHYKSHMIPFAEYLPLPKLLGESSFLQEHMPYPLLKKINQEHTFILPDNTIAAPLICYEALSPSYVSNIVRSGADILFVSSSCSWINNKHFERISAQLIRVSALITSRYVVRCAQDGISMYVDDMGKVYNRSEYITEYVADTVSIKKNLSFYVKNKELVDLFYSFILVTMLIFTRFTSTSTKVGRYTPTLKLPPAGQPEDFRFSGHSRPPEGRQTGAQHQNRM